MTKKNVFAPDFHTLEVFKKWREKTKLQAIIRNDYVKNNFSSKFHSLLGSI